MKLEMCFVGPPFPKTDGLPAKFGLWILFNIWHSDTLAGI